MKTAQEIFVETIESTSNYPAVSEAISAAVDILMIENDEIDTSYVDYALYEKDEKHGLKSSETLRGRRARHIIKNYILELVTASVKEEIMKNGEFCIPENGKNEGLFDAEIISRYEIEDFENAKDDWHDYAYFDIKLKGNLMEHFNKHACSNIQFCAIFEADRFSESFEITDISDVESSIRKIEMLRDYDIPVDNLESLAHNLLANRNKNLFLHAIRCPK